MIVTENPRRSTAEAHARANQAHQAGLVRPTPPFLDDEHRQHVAARYHPETEHNNPDACLVCGDAASPRFSAGLLVTKACQRCIRCRRCGGYYNSQAPGGLWDLVCNRCGEGEDIHNNLDSHALEWARLAVHQRHRMMQVRDKAKNQSLLAAGRVIGDDAGST